MRIKITRTKVYKFGELSAEAHSKVIETLGEINTQCDWWDSVYEDAAQIGITITEFDLYHRTIDGNFEDYPETIAQEIVENHGEQCETHKTATLYLKNRAALLNKYPDDEDGDRGAEGEDAIDDLNIGFKRSILKDYRESLSREYDYLTSREAVIELIDSNGYEFTEKGKLA